MVSIGVSEFRANMNAVLKQVSEGQVVSLTLRDREIAKIVPPDYAQNAARKELRLLRERAVVGDVVSPLDEAWNATSGE